jgi:hypothetical protein
MSFNLLTVSNMKTMKGEGRGYRTFVLHLAPSTVSGYNTCPMASAGCAAACLNTAGRGVYANTQNARIRKTRLFFEDRETFLALLVADINAAIRRTEKAGLVPVFRLNGTSDIRWETVPVMGFRNIMTMFPEVTFYDYSALPNRRNLPPNYSLTFSRKENNDAQIPVAMANGMNVAVVFAGPTLPDMWNGYTVINGDTDDLRFLDPKGVVVGLKAKAKAKKDISGFVVVR